MVIFYWKHQQLIKAADCHFLDILDGNDGVNGGGDKGDRHFYVPLAIRLKTDG